ncbi:hypothetical protein SAMD00023353_1101360 [Rosellinia necatrix]|uniref:Uncharacterized protein n=1 Tax=Rosellinia necatrix TaxID=77044 RepID=A0A1S7UNK0_ROSNE|nr:hypothetical protein SAMD00023353_1101360 [Rosellinia necatrix]
MDFIGLIIGVLSPALAAAARDSLQGNTPNPAANTREVVLYTPTYTIKNPLSRLDRESADIKIRCEDVGPYCWNFPPDAPETESFGVRVFCSAVVRQKGHQHGDDVDVDDRGSRGEVGTEVKRKRSYDIEPSIMLPCPLGATCELTLDVNGEPDAPDAVAAGGANANDTDDYNGGGGGGGGNVYDEDAWIWFENDEGVVPGLLAAEEQIDDPSAWIPLGELVRSVDYSAEYLSDEELAAIDDDHDHDDRDYGTKYPYFLYTEDITTDDDDNDDNNIYDDVGAGKELPIIVALPDPPPDFPRHLRAGPWFTFKCVVPDEDYRTHLAAPASETA